MSYLSHLITDPNAPATVEWARQVEAAKRAATPKQRREGRDLVCSKPSTPAPAPAAPRAAYTGKGEVNADLAHWWANLPAGPAVTVAIRAAAQTFLSISRADFVATLASLGVHPSTAAIQFKKGRG